MIRNDLKRRVARQLGITDKKADQIILSMLGAIHKGIQEDGKVVIKHFGCFKAKDMPAFAYHNPHTGVSGTTDPYRKVLFKTGKGLAELVNREAG